MIPPPLPPGPDKVPQVCELGSAPGGQAGSGAAGEVEAHGCGGLSGAALLPFHQPDSETLCRGTPAAGWWWGRRTEVMLFNMIGSISLVMAERCHQPWPSLQLCRECTTLNQPVALNQLHLEITQYKLSFIRNQRTFLMFPSLLSRTCWCTFSSWCRRSNMRTSAIFRGAWSQASEKARDFQMTPHSTGQYVKATLLHKWVNTTSHVSFSSGPEI